MILVDSSVWIDHLRRPDETLITLLAADQVLGHRFVIGEVAMGSLRDRTTVIGELRRLLQADVATHQEVMALVDSRQLFGAGLSYVDAHLLGSTLLMPGTALWTRDRRLREAAKRLGIVGGPAA